MDSVPPTIDSPDDLSHVEGTTGHAITWTPEDAHPASYAVYRNGTPVASGSSDGSQITVNVDSLAVGVYNYNLVVTDLGGNTATDTVIVTVLQESTTTTTRIATATTTTKGTTTSQVGDGTGWILVIGGSGAAAVVIVLLVVLRRRTS